ncbi:MAG: hypothetical protein BGO38_07820 [Cellulomonas sp. 73-145]|uniref:hypothetical protein n=1 Tax=Cellulomonas sp. 73-145 TaxID=1895739 RepID=UPI00092922D7|nr:hypothetical protein [Cellulomonas sp. 73-145]MBN9327637.1 hypothetical protein [Cellulomonas sp.]OJV58099.1 MAG: hypothetical protein BGO38_07820 [Cellulomonas sp. 73-145]
MSVKNRLGTDARSNFKGADITTTAWARWNGSEDGVWRGDLCGCPDDWCRGYHHEVADVCMCLHVLLQSYCNQREACESLADRRSGRFGVYYPVVPRLELVGGAR